jgi:hypothetical protein
MRTVLGLVIFGLLMRATASGGPTLTCDGRSATEGKCDGGMVPQGYYESQTCEGALPGLGVCKNAIAFNIDKFYCSNPQSDPSTNPPAYTTYCADSTVVVECTVKRTCAGTTITNPDLTQYTFCFHVSTQTTTRLRKRTLFPTTTDPTCTPVIAQPGVE